MANMPNYHEAEKLMQEWVISESLRKHMLSVATTLRAYAKKYGEDEEKWAITGLLHDFDYERYPVPDPITQTGHPYEGIQKLQELGYDQDIVEAILGHATYTNTPRNSLLAKCLFACDELCGFLVACAYIKPDKFATLTPESVEKKLKNKSFAAKVNREDIDQGIQELNVERYEHINFLIQTLKTIEQQIFT